MPYVGQLVNYVLERGSKMPGEIRPAIVVRVWSDTCVNLQVFVDGKNDYENYFESNGQGVNVHWKTSVDRNDHYQPGTWFPAETVLGELLTTETNLQTE